MKTLCAIALLVLVIIPAGIVGIVERWGRDHALEDLRRQVNALAAEPRQSIPIPTPVNIVALPSPVPAPSSSAAPEILHEAVVTTSDRPPKSPVVEMADRHEAYEIAFTQDHADPEWAARAKRIIDDKLPPLLPEGSSIRSFECRATLCRLETSHRDRDAYWRFVNAAFMNPSKTLWNSGVYSTPLNDDPNEGFMVSYLAREGEPLPTLPESVQ